jgi:hypothetical protein
MSRVFHKIIEAFTRWRRRSDALKWLKMCGVSTVIGSISGVIVVVPQNDENSYVASGVKF